MLFFEPWKKAMMAFFVLLGLWSTFPNFFYDTVQQSNLARDEITRLEELGQAATPELEAQAGQWPSWLASGLVNLGLDLQGGSHFLLEAQVTEVHRTRMEQLRDSIGPTLREAGVRRYSGLRVIGSDRLQVRITNPEDVDAARAAMASLIEPVGGTVFGGGGSSFELTEPETQTFQMEMTDIAKQAIDQRTVAQAIEVVRRRVDALGTREPTIQRQGTNRILVQLPGEDVANIPTDQAKLEFQMVAEAVGPTEIANGRIPRDVEILEFDPELNPGREGERIAVFRKVDITGDQLADAQQGFDPQTNLPVVNIRFDTAGARIFGDITRSAVGRRFAMVLDGKVLSAPVIRTAILGGSAQISGDFTAEEANELAINLRSGSLPVALTVEESSVVGPELGQDSVDAGRIACIIAFMLVMVYMALSYGLFGLLANAALILNVSMIFGVLSLLGATLTLPGIAGIVLTIGMAVDANVLVFERIREELRRGRNVVKAITTGYEKALTAIIDANVTTFLAAIILFAMGSGPVKGFAVTLGIGIVTSVFTAVMLTRFFVATWYGYARPKTLEL
ncbi:MAG: protein translocase subunit SecD [Pseudomonadota bacterium]